MAAPPAHDPPECTRRRLLQTCVLTGIATPALLHRLAERGDAADEEQPLNRFPRMVQEWFVRQVREAERRGLRIKNALKSKADAQKYIRSVRAKIRECFGKEPERTPLNPRVTGVVDRDAYTIEKVIFESRPNFPVTANLYIPKGREFPLPGVVGTCGHSANGKAAEAYQSFAQGLGRLGYVCLIYDPIGQGERLQYVKDDLSPLRGTGTAEHLYAGNQQYLVGEFFGRWRAWDGIRALDYLLTREEIDPQQVGVTGNSGGGTMTTWLCGVEPRWTMAAPSCFVTTFRRNLENELPADTEQCPPKALALGLDHDDFLAAQAPDPIIILTKERDYFDIRGSEEAYARLKRLYALLEAEESIAMFTGPTTHGYSQENREAMYRFFNQVTQVSGARSEPEIVIEADETLWCTPHGQVAGLEGTRTVFSFTREKSQHLATLRSERNPVGRISNPSDRQTPGVSTRRSTSVDNGSGTPASDSGSASKTPGALLAAGEPAPTSSDGLEIRPTELVRAVQSVLRLPFRSAASPDYRIWRYLGSRGYPSQQGIAYTVETEPGIQAIVYRLIEERWHSRPPKAGQQAMLYVAHLSSDAELRDEPLIRELIEAQPQTPFFTCDVRGIGESLPGTTRPDSFHSPYGSDYFYAVHSLMLDRPYLGQKTFDVLRVLDWMASLGHTDVHLLGRGWGALPATFAALLSETVTQVTLKNALTSYTEIAESEEYTWPLSALLPNVLAHFDLPDCYRILEKKKLRHIEPWGAMVDTA